MGVAAEPGKYGSYDRAGAEWEGLGDGEFFFFLFLYFSGFYNVKTPTSSLSSPPISYSFVSFQWSRTMNL